MAPKRDVQSNSGLVLARALIRALPALAVLALASPAIAGSLCGTVRDAATSAPIPAAGVFLRQTTGEYTGFHAATNGSGSFCITSIPPGTYDLEILVDDYRVGYLREIAVTGTVNEVPVDVVGGRCSALDWAGSTRGSCN